MYRYIQRRTTLYYSDFIYYNTTTTIAALGTIVLPTNNVRSIVLARIDQILTIDIGTNKTFCFL